MKGATNEWRLMADRRNAWFLQHSALEVPEAISDKLSPAMQVVHGGEGLWGQMINLPPNGHKRQVTPGSQVNSSFYLDIVTLF